MYKSGIANGFVIGLLPINCVNEKRMKQIVKTNNKTSGPVVN